MAKVRLPTLLPGEFFVVTYDRDTERFTLHTDDAQRSSYDLGTNIQEMMRYFRSLNLRDTGYRAIDLAEEFGAAQAIPSQNRVLIYKDAASKKKFDPFGEQEERFPNLPVLR